MSKISKSDAEHFRAAMDGVQPLKNDNRHGPVPPSKPARRQRTAATAESPPLAHGCTAETTTAAVADACEQATALLRQGLPRKVLRQLGSAGNPVADSLDLHGMTAIQARRALQDFLAHSLRDGLTCIRVVHGKGLRSQGAAVLRLVSWQLLWQHPAVLALKPCAPRDGGSGAVLVMLGSHPGDCT